MRPQGGKRLIESESEDEVPLARLSLRTKRKSCKLPKCDSSSDEESESSITSPEKEKKKKQNHKKNDDSSSESDIENYLQHPDEIDFNSDFFKPQASEKTGFESIESNILENINMNGLSDFDDGDMEETAESGVPIHVNFQNLQDYATQMEEAKKVVQKYEAKKKKAKPDTDNTDISNLLALGETKRTSEVLDYSAPISDSDSEDWEEIENNELNEEEKSISKDGVQVVVALPGLVQKKRDKEAEMLASIKRRLNRVRKENQVLVHKVHLLCWLAHGNYINNVLNNENLMGLALSLIPSQHCFPPERTNLKYLEQIVEWYGKLIPISQKEIPQNEKPLEDFLKEQINSKKAYSKKMFVYIFICILRSLGIQCRLVLSFQVEPLRPPASDLHSLSTKVEEHTKNDLKSKQSSSKDKTGSVNDKPGSSKDKPGSSKDKPGSSKGKQGSSKDKPNLVKEKPGSSRDKPSLSKANPSSSKEKSVKMKPSTKTVEKEAATSNTKTKASNQDEKKRKQEKPSFNNKESRVKKVEMQRGDINNQTYVVIRRQSLVEKLTNVHVKEEKKTEGKKEKSKVESRKSSGRSPINPQSSVKEEKVKRQISKKLDHCLLPNIKSESQKKRSEEPKCNTSTNESLKSSSKHTEEKEIKSSKVRVTTKKSLVNFKNSSFDKPKLRSSIKIAQVDGADDTDEESKKPNLKRLSQKSTASACLVKKHEKRLKPRVSYKKPTSSEKSSDDDFEVNPKKKPNLKTLRLPKKMDVKNDIISIMKNRIAKEKSVARSKMVKSRCSRKSSEEDSDYVPVETVKKLDSEDEFHQKTKVKVKQRVKTKRMLENEAVQVKTKKGMDIWVEVFLEDEEKWIAVDLIKGGVHCVSGIYSRASHPVSYIVAWKNDNTIKDITQRYCVNMNTVTRKLRIDAAWWEKSLKPFVGRKSARDLEEDEELALLQLEKPLPTSISEYKNHPLYALERHLLKYEAFYPPNPLVLGFIRKEPVYSRDCVKTLHSKDSWFKFAKVVKKGEEPYKIVLRPKWDKVNRKILKNQPLEAYGEWQVEDYVPPPAENGIVPKNDYGNVELFQKSMLPKGTVHLQLPGLNKIAKRMNIDCPAAMVGFDVHHGWTHPVFDGFIVCEEHSETLIAAWHMEQEEIEKKEKEKVEKRVYDNWKKLIKGLLIRQRLEARYKFGESSNSVTDVSKRKSAESKFTKNKRQKKGNKSEAPT